MCIARRDGYIKCGYRKLFKGGGLNGEADDLRQRDRRGCFLEVTVHAIDVGYIAVRKNFMGGEGGELLRR